MCAWMCVVSCDSREHGVRRDVDQPKQVNVCAAMCVCVFIVVARSPMKNVGRCDDVNNTDYDHGHDGNRKARYAHFKTTKLILPTA
jgi:hypothetical protein